MVYANLDLTEEGRERRVEIVSTFLKDRNIAFDLVKIDIPGYRYEFVFAEKVISINHPLVNLVKNFPHEFLEWTSPEEDEDIQN